MKFNISNGTDVSILSVAIQILMIQTNINTPYAMKYALVSEEDKPFAFNQLALVLLEEVKGFIDEKKTNQIYTHLKRLQLAEILTRKRQVKTMQQETTRHSFIT